MSLTAEERVIYEWQMWVPGMGEEGQLKLKNARVLVSRVGGLGGLVALELAAEGPGRPGFVFHALRSGLAAGRAGSLMNLPGCCRLS